MRLAPGAGKRPERRPGGLYPAGAPAQPAKVGFAAVAAGLAAGLHSYEFFCLPRKRGRSGAGALDKRGRLGDTAEEGTGGRDSLFPGRCFCC